MKVTIIGRKVNLKDSFKNLTEKKLARFDRIFEDDAEAKVEVTVEKNRQTVEITIRSRGMIYRAESTLDDMSKALDDVLDSLGNQIRKNKKRLTKKLRTTGLTSFGELSEEEKAEQEDYQIVRTKRFIVKPMSVDEAILQMELLEHQFFLFRNAATGTINVVYRRKDGGFGLLDPEE